MKLFVFVIGFVFIIGIEGTEVITPAPTVPQFYYPPHHEFAPNQCHAYPTLELVICSTFTAPFNVTHLNALKSLIIHNYQQKLLPQTEVPKGPPKSPELQLDHLAIYFENSKAESKQISPELLRLPTKSIKILSNHTLESLDMSQLSTKLNSIYITQVAKLKMTNFDFTKFTALKQIHLREIGFEPPISSLTFQDSPLTYVELSNTNFAGKFMFTPKSCEHNSKIHIILHGNSELTDFDFAALFANPKAPNCHYHIDLSDNSKLRPDLLTTQLTTLDESKLHLLDIQLRNVNKLLCDCKLYELYHKALVGRLHNVMCWKNGKEADYLDLVQRRDVC